MENDYRTLVIVRQILRDNNERNSALTNLAQSRWELIRQLDCAEKKAKKGIHLQIEKLDELIVMLINKL